MSFAHLQRSLTQYYKSFQQVFNTFSTGFQQGKVEYGDEAKRVK
jgi:hypothetical protein